MDASLIILLWVAAAAGLVLFFQKYPWKKFKEETLGVPWTGQTKEAILLQLAEQLELKVQNTESVESEMLAHVRKRIPILQQKIRTLQHGREAQDALQRAERATREKDTESAVRSLLAAQEIMEDAELDEYVDRHHSLSRS